MTYAFTFDASACSGCKACQAACKDKNNLPPGVLWRRVIEVSGGEWTRNGGAWENTVFAYNLSMACNHCVHPKCAGVCPTNAYHVRADGIVLLDSTKCVGCGYCNWACPYAVPQYSPLSGLMSKCNFCFDSIDAGQPPACVAACPLRVLDFEILDESEIEQPGISLWKRPGSEHPFPLPVFSRTQPHVRINPHPGMSNNLEKHVANREEIKPQQAKSENPLVAFTLFSQMAVGAFWFLQVFLSPFANLIRPDAFFLRMALSLLVELLLGLGILLAFAHLGARKNAWRMLGNLHKSWLSKEILFMGLFGAGSLVSILFPGGLSALVTALLGFALIYSMSNVYRLRSMAVWNTWRTLASFTLSTLLLGQALLLPALLLNASFTGVNLPSFYLVALGLLTVALMGLDTILLFTSPQTDFDKTARPCIFLTTAVLLVLISVFFTPPSLQFLPYTIILLLLFVQQALGRRNFYTQLNTRIL